MLQKFSIVKIWVSFFLVTRLHRWQKYWIKFKDPRPVKMIVATVRPGPHKKQIRYFASP